MLPARERWDRCVDPNPRVLANRQEAVCRQGKSLILPAAEHSIGAWSLSRLPVASPAGA